MHEVTRAAAVWLFLLAGRRPHAAEPEPSSYETALECFLTFTKEGRKIFVHSQEFMRRGTSQSPSVLSSSRFKILPAADIGSAATKRTDLGTLYLASRAAQWAISSASVAAAPGLRTT